MRESIPMLPSTRSLTCSTPLAPLTPLVAPLGSGSQLGHIVRKSRGVEWGRGERNERGKEAIRSLLSERKRVSHVLPLGKSQPTARTARSGSRVGRGRYREGEKSHRRKEGHCLKRRAVCAGRRQKRKFHTRSAQLQQYRVHRAAIDSGQLGWVYGCNGLLFLDNWKISTESGVPHPPLSYLLGTELLLLRLPLKHVWFT